MLHDHAQPLVPELRPSAAVPEGLLAGQALLLLLRGEGAGPGRGGGAEGGPPVLRTLLWQQAEAAKWWFLALAAVNTLALLFTCLLQVGQPTGNDCNYYLTLVSN